MVRRRNFSQEELATLFRGPSVLEDQSERECPACGQTSVRFYVRKSARAGQATLMNHMWCASCGTFFASTGGYPRGLVIHDRWREVDPDGWRDFKSTVKVFDVLDRLWRRGVLPQSFTWE